MNDARKRTELRNDPYDTGDWDRPAGTVLAQDNCIGDGWLDVDAWSTTVFFPLAMFSGGGTMVVETKADFAKHLDELQQTARLRGAVGFRTRILSQNQTAPNMAIVTSHRDHVDEAGQVVTSSSITWSLILTPDGWRINQIHFNDARNDPSVVSELLRDTGDLE